MSGRPRPWATAHHGRVQILWWLAFPAGVTLLAMAVVGWSGRARPERRSDADQERFAAAILREHPGTVRTRARSRDRSTGIAVRPSRQPAPVDHTRRSA